MKRSEFKKGLTLRLRLLSALTSFSAKEILTYSFNNWGGLISTVSYTLTYLAFLSIIYSRVKLIAGYDLGEVLFFTIIGQINYYMLWTWSTPSIHRLTETVRNGELDLILIRPVPALWFVSIRRIRLPALLFEALPALIAPLIMTARNFHSPIPPLGLIVGIVILLCGQLLLHCLHFMVASFSFWSGEGKGTAKLVDELSEFGEAVPWEGFPLSLKMVGSVILPVLIASALSTSFMLGKNREYWLILPVLGLTIFFVYAKIKLWQRALRSYSSASS